MCMTGRGMCLRAAGSCPDLIKQIARAQGVDEKLKASDQMRWVRIMNNIRNAAEEIVINEIVYV